MLPCDFSHSASLAASVVLPEPCRPASMMTVGGTLANRSRRASPPRIVDQFLVDDLDDLLRRVQRLGDLGAAGRRSRTLAMNSRTTGRATSASSSAIRISRQVASMSACGQPPAPAQGGEDLAEPIGKCLEHVGLPSSAYQWASRLSRPTRHIGYRGRHQTDCLSFRNCSY